MDNKQSRYLEYLPAIYQEDCFLGQFLWHFEKVLTGFEEKLSVVDRNFSPALAPSNRDHPDQDFLPWLASWLALTPDENWDEAKQRRLIQEAVKLYRQRGTVEGLKRDLKIYQDRVIPVIREGCWPGGMQIGVASQIGEIVPDKTPLTRIVRAARREPPSYHDYYVIIGPPPDAPADQPEGQPLRRYYRADLVKRVEVGDEIGKESVTLYLLDNRVHRYSPATVLRLDGLLSENYTLTLESGSSFYKGNTFLIDEVEQPYCFTVNIRIPLEAWEFLFSFQIDLPKNGEELSEEKFQEEFELHRISHLNVTKKNYRWWEIEGKINNETQRYVAVRKGVRLDVYTWVGRQDWEMAKKLIDVKSVQAIIDEAKPAHTLYYLKLIPAASQDYLQPMQLGVHSTVDVDTSIG